VVTRWDAREVLEEIGPGWPPYVVESARPLYDVVVPYRSPRWVTRLFVAYSLFAGVLFTGLCVRLYGTRTDR
jgi:hypothetical protein